MDTAIADVAAFMRSSPKSVATVSQHLNLSTKALSFLQSNDLLAMIESEIPSLFPSLTAATSNDLNNGSFVVAGSSVFLVVEAANTERTACNNLSSQSFQSEILELRHHQGAVNVKGEETVTAGSSIWETAEKLQSRVG